MKISNSCVHSRSRLALWCGALLAALAPTFSASADGVGATVLRPLRPNPSQRSVPASNILRRVQLPLPGDEIFQGVAPASTIAQSEGSTQAGPRPRTTVSTSWEGMISDFTTEPPDPHGAAGPNGIIQVINTRIAYFNKTGTALWGPVPLDGMFSSVGNNSFSFDPHALYDPGSGRFYVVLLEQDTTTTNSYLNLAVSKTSNPQSSGSADWYLYRKQNTAISGNTLYWGDYPGFGFDSQAIYTTVNMFDFNDNYSGVVEIGVWDKSGFLNGSGNTNVAYVFTSNIGEFTLQPCSVRGTNSPGNIAYFAENILGNNTTARVWALSDPLGARTLASASVTIPDNGGFAFGGAPQPGISIPIDTVPMRTQGNAVWINGALWFCNTAGGSSGKAQAYWYKINANGFPASQPTFGDEGHFDGGSGEWTYQPSICCNPLGDVCIVYCQSSQTRYPSIFASTRSATQTDFDPPVLIKASPGYYFGGRWGDFASVTPDPIDDTFWVTHEYSHSTQIFDWGTWWANVQPRISPSFLIVSNFVTGGNGNGIIDFDECNNLSIILTNTGSLGATNVQVTLSSATPGVFITQPRASYPNMPVGVAGTNITPFTISTFASFVCGIPIDLTVLTKCDQATLTNQLRLPTGVPILPVKFDNSSPVQIPDADTAGTNSYIVVSNMNAAVTKVGVSVYITHTFDSDLVLELISPEGLTNTLAAHRGSSGQNFGLSCSPEFQRTTFDDDAAFRIGVASPPFVGSFIPDKPLSIFSYKSGTNVNGLWALHVRDDFAGDVGAIQCWSLFLYSSQCQDGGGECPGADLAVGITAQPEPVVVGNNLTYVISVTNRGPSSAKNVVASHLLPPSVSFLSATLSQGSYSQSGGIVSGSFGSINAGGRATMTVTVLPAAAGAINSTASVSSNDTDPDPSNNSASVITHVNPPTADLAVGLIAAPEPVVLGGSLTYSVSVTNNGPSSASGVTVTNILPPSVVVLSATTSQGSISTISNLVICNFNTLPNGARATATINVTPTAEGIWSATASVTANQLDPISGNNSRSVVSTVGPAADLGVTIIDNPHSVILRSNYTYVVTVVNNGPSLATGVSVNGSRPPGLTLVSSNTSQGTITTTTNGLTWNVGTLIAGASAKAFFTNFSTVSGNLVANVAVTGSQNDPNSANNTATVTTLVSAPFVSIAAGSATLTAESLNPTNGAIDVNETVTTVLRLRNSGNVVATNVSATLLATNFVTPVGNNFQTYPVLPPGANADGRPFTFTTTGTNGQTVAATLQVQANGITTNVLFFFTLSRSSTFSNTAFINIRDNTSALPYPSTLNVSGLTGVVGKATVTLVNSSHTFPQDIDILLVGPHGQKTLLMSGAGAPPLANANIIFDDSFAAIPDGNGQITSGSYHPASYAGVTALPAPAPVGPYPAAMSVFNLVDPNGQWSLYAADHTSGDVGNIAGGWALSLTIISPVNKLADLGISVVDSPDPCVAGGNLTYTFTVTNRGPDTANNVSFIDVLPANLGSITTSTNVTFASGTISGSFGSLPFGGTAVVTVSGTPTGPAGTLTNIASVSASELDLNSANNTVFALTTITNPVADVALSQVVSTNVVIVGSNVTYNLIITNQGPGAALNLVVSDPAPARVSLSSASSVDGTWALSGGAIIVTFTNTLPAGSSASVTINGVATSAGLSTNVATVSTASTDNNLVNNSAAVVLTLAEAAPNIVPAGTALVSELPGPPNGTIDSGETVTVSFALRNAGVADTANLIAALQATGGVTPGSGAQQSYGVLAHGGAPVARTFGFTANGPSGGTIVATFLLSDGGTSRGTVTFAFTLPATGVYGNSSPITIPDHGSASPYPSIINVSGRTGQVSSVQVSLSGLTHSFPRDVSVLLVSPSGTNVLLMSHTGGGHAVNNLALTFDDSAASSLPISDQIISGTYKPTAGGTVNFPSFAPVGPYNQNLASLNGTVPNGTWSLFVLDDAAGDAGVINNGWSLNLGTSVLLPQPFSLAATALNNQIVVKVSGEPGLAFTIQASTNLSSWTDVVAGTIAADGAYTYSEALAPSPTGHFYRAVHQAP